MSLTAHIAPWSGDVYRHIPATSPYGVLDFRYAGLDPANRWNDGEPTLYVTSDPETAMVEFARHFDENRTAMLAAQTVARRMYRLEMTLDSVLDLCSPDVSGALGLAEAPTCFLDKTIARATAHYARYGLGVQAIRAPSMGFLDQLSHWCLVVFLEALPRSVSAWIRSVEEWGLVEVHT